MDKNKASFWFSMASVGISLVTLFYAYIKPNWIDSSKFELTQIKQLTITHLFGDIQLNKEFAITNVGKREALINRIECYLISEPNYDVTYYGDTYYISDPDYMTNDKKARFSLLNGITLWTNNGFASGLYYVTHHDQNYISAFQEVRDSIFNGMEAFKIKHRKSRWDETWIDSFKLNNSIKNKIVELQTPTEQYIRNGTYFLCERLVSSEGKVITQVYRFQLSDKEVKTLKKLTSEIDRLCNPQVSQSVTVDLKLASTEEKEKIMRKIKDYDSKIN